MISVRRYQESDWPLLWPLLQATFASGDTYAFSPASNEAEIHTAWVEAPAATYVACAPDGNLLGTYILKANQPGLGSHVCNCGYVVAPDGSGPRRCLGHVRALAARGRVDRGFSAMQFNLVVSTNERAIRLWKRLGFHVVGTLPRAFRHQRLGFVDALVMYKKLAT